MHSNFVDLNPKYAFEQSKKKEKRSLIEFKKNLEAEKRDKFKKFIRDGNKLTAE